MRTSWSRAGNKDMINRGGEKISYKWPERLEIMTELPVTKVGKLDKKALRDTLVTAGRSQA